MFLQIVFTSNHTEDKFSLLTCFYSTDKKMRYYRMLFQWTKVFIVNSDLSYFFTPFSCLEYGSPCRLNNNHDNNNNIKSD